MGYGRLFVLAALVAGLAPACPAQATADSVVFSQGAFSVSRRNGPDGRWICTLKDGTTSYAEVHQEGANLRTWVATVDGIPYSVFNDLGNPKLMPWPNRTKGGRFLDAGGVERNLMVRDGQGRLLTTDDGKGNALHGMVQHRLWTVEEAGADAEGVFLRCYFDTEGFPAISALFGAFRDYTVFRLKGGRLIFDSYTQNKGEQAFRNCGWGWHPWINAPLIPRTGAQKGSRSRCSLLMPARSVALVDGALIPTGENRDVATQEGGRFDFTRMRSLAGQNYDHYFTDLQADPATPGYTRSVLVDFGNKVRVNYFAQFPFYPWMVIYLPGSPNVICIEHQTEEVNGLNTKRNLINISAGGRSPVGRVMVTVDGDTTLAMPVATAPLSRQPALLGRAAVRFDREASAMRFFSASGFPGGRLPASFDARGVVRPTLSGDSRPSPGDGRQ